jgi:hypothetical protein
MAGKICSKENEKWLVTLGTGAVISMEARFPVSFSGFYYFTGS